MSWIRRDEKRSPERYDGEEHNDGDAREGKAVLYQNRSKLTEPFDVVREPLAKQGKPPSGDGGLHHLHASRTRGSRNMYRTSALALATTTPIVAIRKNPERRGEAKAVVAS